VEAKSALCEWIVMSEVVTPRWPEQLRSPTLRADKSSDVYYLVRRALYRGPGGAAVLGRSGVSKRSPACV
jgi:hypothetical protein